MYQLLTKQNISAFKKIKRGSVKTFLICDVYIISLNKREIKNFILKLYMLYSIENNCLFLKIQNIQR